MIAIGASSQLPHVSDIHLRWTSPSCSASLNISSFLKGLRVELGRGNENSGVSAKRIALGGDANHEDLTRAATVKTPTVFEIERYDV